MYKLMTPGPTMVRENVRQARSLITTNPDLDLDFYEEYHQLCGLISSLLGTKNETYILGGEGILGLEAACASLTEPGDKVLVLDNGIYGKGFRDFVTLYGGIPTLYTADYSRDFDIEALAQFLETNHDFKYATVVHCDTPSGVLNDVGRICPLLSQYNILTVVDSVSGMFGHEIHVDDSHIDILCGGSQKAVSAPAGLTFVTVSPKAMETMIHRQTPIASFYANLLVFKDYYRDKWFPYTMPISDIYGLRAAFENIAADTEIYNRHHAIAKAVRKAIIAGGLKLHLESGFSDTVTVVDVPDAIDVSDILETMKKGHGIMIAGSFDILAGKVFRIGHMGENANIEDVSATLKALTQTFKTLGHPLKEAMDTVFLKTLN